MSSRDTDFDNLKRNFAQIQYKHLMEEEWNKKYVGLPYQAKINLADRILTQKNFPSGPSAEVIRRFKDSIRSQKELVQKQKKAYEERKKREAVMENSMREARRNAMVYANNISNKIPIAPVAEGNSEVVARVITPSVGKHKKKSTGCFGKWCSKDDALDGGRKRTTRKRRRRKKRKTRKKRTYRSKTRRRKKRTKRKTRKRRR
tara:strand:- start:790 stop:1398 length:609 start_codon:yes stop_codon:yes gene_type:complete